jgi:hypothetical protein
LNFDWFQTAAITPVNLAFGKVAGGKVMDEIQRRAFMKGAAIGALAFSVGGAEVMLTPRQAQAHNIPLRTLTP